MILGANLLQYRKNNNLHRTGMKHMTSSEKPPWNIVQQAMGNLVQEHIDDESKASLFLPGPKSLFFRLCLKAEKAL